MSANSKPHSDQFIVRDAMNMGNRYTVDEGNAALNRLVEQFGTFLDAAWKFEHEMACGEFVHFGEFRRALVAASGEDRGSNPASELAEDDRAIAEIVRERDANDTGERLTLEEVAAEVGVDLDALREAQNQESSRSDG